MTRYDMQSRTSASPRIRKLGVQRTRQRRSSMIRPITSSGGTQPRTRNDLGSLLHLHSLAVRTLLVRQANRFGWRSSLTSNLLPQKSGRHPQHPFPIIILTSRSRPVHASSKAGFRLHFGGPEELGPLNGHSRAGAGVELKTHPPTAL